jgi:hypothetical protein
MGISDQRGAAPYSSDFQAFVKSLTYDFENTAGRLEMVEGDCCDMDGCVELFKRLDERVQRIETYAGGQWHATYVVRDGDWEALPGPAS